MKLTKQDLNNLDAANDAEMVDTVLDVNTYDLRRDLVRLARLGLWAEEKAIPLLEQVQPAGDWYAGFHYEAEKALSALPK